MMNLRSGLSALALVGAIFSFSHAANAATLSSINIGALDGTAGDQVDVAVVDTNLKGGSYKIVVNNYVDPVSAGNIVHGPISNTAFSAAVNFTLTNGDGVTFSDYGYTGGKFTNVQYNLLDGATTLTPDVAGSDPLSWSGLASEHPYELLITGNAVSGPGSVTGTLSAVPLPGSLVMFGSALLGLTALGARRRSAISA